MVLKKAKPFIVAKPPPLPPLPKLRLRKPDALQDNPCAAVLGLVLSCYASLGQQTAGCQKLEEELKKCVDGTKAKTKSTNTINYHLSRLYPQMRPNTKRR